MDLVFMENRLTVNHDGVDDDVGDDNDDDERETGYRCRKLPYSPLYSYNREYDDWLTGSCPAKLGG